MDKRANKEIQVKISLLVNLATNEKHNYIRVRKNLIERDHDRF
jgi:hypothetical protein